MNTSHPTQSTPHPSSLQALPSPDHRPQLEAFHQLAEARLRLHRHLHGFKPAVELILERARAAAHNKNIAKKYFHQSPALSEPLGDEIEQLQGESLSEALLRLRGKQALYAECIALASANGAAQGAGNHWLLSGSPLEHFATLQSLEVAYTDLRSELVLANQRLVFVAAGSQKNYGIERDDVVQLGMIALQKAVEGYDPSSGNKFSTYAVAVINGEIVRASEQTSLAIRLPSHVWVKVRGFLHARDTLMRRLTDNPSIGEVAAEMGIPICEALELERHLARPVSLSTPLDDGESGGTLADILADEGGTTPHAGILPSCEDLLAPFVDTLDSIEREVILLHVGPSRGAGMELEDIAAQFRVQQGTVRRAFESGLEKIARCRRQSGIAA